MKIKYVSKICSLGLIPGFCFNELFPPHAHCDILTGKTGVIWKYLVCIQCSNPGVLQHCRADKSSSFSTLRAVSVFPWPTFSHKENTAHICLTFKTLKKDVPISLGSQAGQGMFSLDFLPERSLYLKTDIQSIHVSVCETKHQHPEMGQGPSRVNYTGSHCARIIVHSLCCAWKKVQKAVE